MKDLLETLVSENSFSRRLEQQIDFDWLIEQVKPYFPDTQDRTAAPIRTLCLIMLEHLEPYGLSYTDRPFLASIYENWRDNTAYMWLLQAVPGDIPVYKALSNFENIPAFEDIFFPVASKLPLEIMRKLLTHILTNCVDSRIAAEYPDQPLYYMNQLSQEEKTIEIGRLSNDYAEQFYKEITAYQDWKGR